MDAPIEIILQWLKDGYSNECETLKCYCNRDYFEGRRDVYRELYDKITELINKNDNE